MLVTVLYSLFSLTFLSMLLVASAQPPAYGNDVEESAGALGMLIAFLAWLGGLVAALIHSSDYGSNLLIAVGVFLIWLIIAIPLIKRHQRKAYR